MIIQRKFINVGHQNKIYLAACFLFFVFFNPSANDRSEQMEVGALHLLRKISKRTQLLDKHYL